MRFTRVASGLVIGVMAAAGLAACGSSDSSDDESVAFPEDGIEIVVAYAPGGPTDAGARLIAEQMQSTLGESVVVVNREGAAAAVGTGEVAQAKADGYKLLFTSSGPFLQTAVKDDLPYEISDFTTIGGIAEIPYIVLVPGNSTIESTEDLKGMTGIKYGSPGVGSTPDVIMAVTLDALDVESSGVPYDGDATVLQALLGKKIDIAALSPQAALPYIENGELRPIVVKSASPIEGLDAGVPTMADLGIDDQTFAPQMGLLAPAGTPDEVVKILQEALAEAVASDKVQQFYVTSGWSQLPDAPVIDWLDNVTAQSKSYGDVMTRLNAG